ncbi:hypothetical protein GCM10028808_45800 [Spirosoma migulaei]
MLSNISNSKKASHTTLLKRATLVYILLLLFEGALRKWILPGLSGPLLIVRDPVAIFILIIAWRYKILPQSVYISLMSLVGILSIFIAVILGHGNLAVAIYGARILLLHFPLIFIIGIVLTNDDVVQIGKLILWISIPMTVIIALQFYSPQSAWINRGIGGDTSGGGFGAGAQGYFRPPGTFSFISGVVEFYSLVACFVCYFALNTQKINRLLLAVSAFCLIVAVPFSISRTLLVSVGITLFFVTIVILKTPRYIGRFLISTVVLLFVFISLSNTPFFQNSVNVFLDRFTRANLTEGGLEGSIVNRFLGGMLEAITESDTPFWGYGIGMGTNVGSQLLTGARQFLIAEAEWGRLIGELGKVLGIIVILIRVHLTVRLAYLAYMKIESRNVLAWLLVSFGFYMLIQSQWARPTTLGFSTLIGGLIIASLKKNPSSATNS